MKQEILNYMPGPVSIHTDVKQVFTGTFLSHRSEKFYSDVAAFAGQLCRFVHAERVAFLVGSGSLANEMVAHQLRLLEGTGLILVNGEFGRRLTAQAAAIGLAFETLERPLGQSFDYDEISSYVTASKPAWIWFVHCETSSGVLNDMSALKKIARKYGSRLAADCISSIANTPVDLRGVYLASGTSGKGIGSYAGIAMVYHTDEALHMKEERVPRYFSLKHHDETRLVPYTVSTNLFYALIKAFSMITPAEHRLNIRFISDFIHRELVACGLSILGNKEEMMPGIITVMCPPSISAFDLGVALETKGIYVNFGGAYLRKGNYFQVCVMGHHEIAQAATLVNSLRELLAKADPVRMAV